MSTNFKKNPLRWRHVISGVVGFGVGCKLQQFRDSNEEEYVRLAERYEQKLLLDQQSKQ